MIYCISNECQRRINTKNKEIFSNIPFLTSLRRFKSKWTAFVGEVSSQNDLGSRLVEKRSCSRNCFHSNVTHSMRVLRLRIQMLLLGCLWAVITTNHRQPKNVNVLLQDMARIPLYSYSQHWFHEWDVQDLQGISSITLWKERVKKDEPGFDNSFYYKLFWFFI